MATFSNTELTNASSKFFVGALLPSFVGGQSDSEELHKQILEVAKTVFVLHPNAFYSLVVIVRNKLNKVLSKEIDLVEDMLIALQDVISLNGLILPKDSSTSLKNAITNLLNVETASSIGGRVEFQQFDKQLEDFSLQFKPLTSNGKLRLHPNEAKEILKSNFSELKKNHDELLTLFLNLADLLSVLKAFDLSSSLSSSSLVKVREELTSLVDQLEKGDLILNQTSSRKFLLSTLSARAAVKSILNFDVPDKGFTLKSDGTGFSARGIVGTKSKRLGSGPPFRFRMRGTGTFASISTNQGPWLLDDLSQNTLSISVDGATAQSVDLSSITGPGIHGSLLGPWPDTILHPAWPGPQASSAAPPASQEDYKAANELHVVLDNNIYQLKSERWGYSQSSGVAFMEGEDTSAGVAPAARNTTVPSFIPDNPPSHGGLLVSDYWTTVRCQPPVKLGFKHLGSIVTFDFPTVTPGSSTSTSVVEGAGFASWSVSGEDQLANPARWATTQTTRWNYLTKPRVLTELTLLKSVFITAINGNLVTGPATSFENHFVGYYIRTNASQRYEITQFISDTQIQVEFRGDVISSGQTVGIFGSRGDFTQFSFSPDLLINTRDVADSSNLGPHNVRDTVSITVGPTIKTSSIPSGLSTGSISEVVAALNSDSNGSHGSNTYAHASKHVIFKETPGNQNTLTIENRSRFLTSHFRLIEQFTRVEQNLLATTNTPLVIGSSATITSINSSNQTLTGLTGITENDVGKALIISGAATTNNNGTFQIVSIARQVPTDPNVDPDSGVAILGSPIIFNPNGTGTDANNGSISWQLIRMEDGFPSPKDPILVTNTATSVFGFKQNQRATSNKNTYLTKEDLKRVIDSSTTGIDVKINNSVVVTGLLSITANSFSVQDTQSLNFASQGVQSGMTLEIQEGEDSGRYIIDSVSTTSLILEFPGQKNSRGFLRNASNIRYKILSDVVSLSSLKNTRGSSIQVTSSPTSFGFDSSVVYGIGTQLEAVNKQEELLDLSGLVKGDKINNTYTVVNASDSFVEIQEGVSSRDISFLFTVTSSLEQNFKSLSNTIKTLFSASNLLPRYGFEEDLSFIDGALSSVLTQGVVQLPNINRLAQILADLHGMLAASPRRSSEITTKITPAVLNFESTISPFSAPRNEALDSLLELLREKGYDRAIELLESGDLGTFFSLSVEESSFSGNLINVSKTVLNDLPTTTTNTSSVIDTITTADSQVELSDPDTDFSDTLNELEGDLV